MPRTTPARSLTAAAAVLTTLGLSAVAADAAAPPRPAGSTTIPTIVTAGKKTPIVMYAPVVIAGKKALMVVDSGAQGTILDKRVAKRLRLPKAGKPSTSRTIGCSSPSQPVRIKHWSVGGVPLPPSVISANSTSAASLKKIKGVPVVGQLGADALSSFGVATVDFLNAQLVVGGAFAPTATTFPVTTLPSKSGRRSFMIAKVGVGSVKTGFALDTGASVSTIDASITRRAHLKKVGKKLTVGAISCKTKVQPVRLKTWSVGGFALKPSVGVSRDTGLAKVSRGAIHGLLGADVLAGAFGQVTFDYTDLQVALGYPAPAPTPAPSPTPAPGGNVAPPSPTPEPGGNVAAPPRPSS